MNLRAGEKLKLARRYYPRNRHLVFYWHFHICSAQFYIHRGDIIYIFLFALEWQLRIIVQCQQYVSHCTAPIPWQCWA